MPTRLLVHLLICSTVAALGCSEASDAGPAPNVLSDAGVPDAEVGIVGQRRGRYFVVNAFPATRLGNTRTVTVWMPEIYDRAPDQRFPVLYAHDGQNLFDPDAAAFGTAWGLGETVDRLTREGAIEPMIVVGIYNTPDRIYEYTPSVNPEFGEGGGAEDYGRFVVEELKPWIDATLRTRPDRMDTGLMGSSLGGLVSLYMLARWPEVFGRVSAVSSSLWWGEMPPVWMAPLAADALTDVRLWMDGGTLEGAEEGADPDGNHLGSVLDDTRRFVAYLIGEVGLSYGTELAYHEHVGGEHNEASWAARLDQILVWTWGVPITEPSALSLRLHGPVMVGHRTAWSADATHGPVTLTWPAEALDPQSSDPAVMGIDGGDATGVAPGEATLSVRLNALEASLPVQVSEGVTVSFQVTVPEGTPAEDSIYLSGDVPALGAWDPAGFVAMEHQGGGVWTRDLVFAAGSAFVFKINRGSWETVEKYADGGEVDDRAVQADANQRVEVNVESWADWW